MEELGSSPEANPVGNPQWKKGVSGNPAGRAKVDVEFRMRARRLIDEKGFQRLVTEIESDGPRWFEAVKLLAAYGYGAPTQSVEIATKDATVDPLAGLSNEELIAYIRARSH